MKNKLINIFLILALVAGLSLLLYPTVSDYWNSLHASQAVASYDQAVKSMDEGKYDELLHLALGNTDLLLLQGRLHDLRLFRSGFFAACIKFIRLHHRADKLALF